MTIHPTACIESGAKLGKDVTVGPWCTIGAEVEIGEGTVLHPHVHLTGRTRLGARNEVFPFASIGTPPQDPKFKGERTSVEIGDENIFRENVTVNAGTQGGGGITRIGHRNLFMAYAHVGHDCQVGSHGVYVNHVNLGGHVSAGDYVVLSGYVGVTQFVRIGSHAMVGAGCIVSKDIPPFVRGKARGTGRFEPSALNRVGLERRGFSKMDIAALDESFRIFYLRRLSASEALSQLRDRFANNDHVKHFADFLESSSRGVAR